MYDLNVPWPATDYTTKPSPTQILNLKNVIITLYNLGYRLIAINFQINELVKLPKDQLNPIPMAALTKDLCSKFPDLKLFSRVTISINDPSKSQSLVKLQQYFDILAVQPLNEKALQLSITNLDIDLISFNFTNKLPFFLKHKTIGSAIDKGIKFEVQYAHLINGYANSSVGVNANLFKKFFINNVLLLIRTSRSKGIVVSSGALDPVQTRNASDILTLLVSLGLDLQRSKACVTINPERTLIAGRLRAKLFKQSILIDNDKVDVLTNNDVGDEVTSYKKRLSDSSSGRLLKKMRKS